jgi:hypothetical protein
MILDLPHVLTVFATVVTVVLCVLLHYESLSVLGRWLTVERLAHRARIVAMMFGLVVVHIVEIWGFALTYLLLAAQSGFGGFIANIPMIFVDYVYFSAVTYTSLGFGEIVPYGALRFLAGTEALVGLLMIGWTVAYTHLEMQRYWGRD